MNTQTVFTGHHRRVFDCIRLEVEAVERYCRSSCCVGHSEGYDRVTFTCGHSATLIMGMSYPYAGENLGTQDGQIVVFADLASAYVRTLWRDTVGSLSLDAKVEETRQRYHAELARLTGDTASAGKDPIDQVEAT